MAPFDNCQESSFDIELFFLNYATRLLLSFTDHEILVRIALETMTDFSCCKKTGILRFDEEKDELLLEGVFENSQPRKTELKLACAGSAFTKVFACKSSLIFPAAGDGSLPLPSETKQQSDKWCLCLPIVANLGRVIGAATIELESEQELDVERMQRLRILMTVLAIAFENARLFSLAVMDSLTGLYVRRFFEIKLDEGLAKLKRKPGNLALVLIDLDHFKEINDSQGHFIGDLALKSFAGLLREHVRQGTDLVCRHGGEEFAILMEDTDLETAFAVADRLRRICAETVFMAEGAELRLSFSAGVAMVSERDLLEANELFRRADLMLYEAKSQGRNSVRVYDPQKRKED